MSRSRPPKCPGGRGCVVCRSPVREERNRLRDAERLRLDLVIEDEREDDDYGDCDSCARGCCGFDLSDEDCVDLVLARARELRVPLIEAARIA